MERFKYPIAGLGLVAFLFFAERWTSARPRPWLVTRLWPGWSAAAAPPSPFAQSTFQRPSGEKAAYCVYEPPGYSSRQRYPLVVFLHGYGERGTDGLRPAVKSGIGPAVSRQTTPFDFFILFPQSKSGFWDAGTDDNKRALELTEHACRSYPIDRDRVYLTGLSNGGYGVWNVAAASPDRWAALVPVAGGSRAGLVDRIRHIPVWSFHGGKDTTIPPQNARLMVEALKAAGADVRYTELPNKPHNIWNDAYLNPKLYEWLLAQHRPAAAAGP